MPLSELNAITHTHAELLRDIDRMAADELVTLWRMADSPQAKRAVLLDYLPDVASLWGETSATLSAQFYEDVRILSNVAGRYEATVARPATRDQVEIMIRNATAGWLDGRADEDVLSQISGGLRRLVRQPERETLIESGKRDPVKARWVRITQPRACDFCLLMVTRGAVYSADTVEFNAHDHCRCFGRAVFHDEQIPPEIAELSAEYQSVASGAGTSKEIRAAWRAHVRETRK